MLTNYSFLLTWILFPQYGQETKSLSDSSIKSDTFTSKAFAIADSVFKVGLPDIATEIVACVTFKRSASSFCETPFSFNIVLILFFILQNYKIFAYIFNSNVKCCIYPKYLTTINNNNFAICRIYTTFAQKYNNLINKFYENT